MSVPVGVKKKQEVIADQWAHLRAGCIYLNVRPEGIKDPDQVAAQTQERR